MSQSPDSSQSPQTSQSPQSPCSARTPSVKRVLRTLNGTNSPSSRRNESPVWKHFEKTVNGSECQVENCVKVFSKSTARGFVNKIIHTMLKNKFFS